MSDWTELSCVVVELGKDDEVSEFLLTAACGSSSGWIRVWSKCSCRVLTCISPSDTCVPLAHVALSLSVKLHYRSQGWWIWLKVFPCLFTCRNGSSFHLLNAMWLQLCHVADLTICALLSPGAVVLLFFLCEWVHCAVFLGANQYTIDWSLANCQGSELRPLVSALTQALHGAGSRAGTPWADLTSCSADVKTFLLLPVRKCFLWVLVHSRCYNKILQTEWLLNNIHFS